MASPGRCYISIIGHHRGPRLGSEDVVRAVVVVVWGRASHAQSHLVCVPGLAGSLVCVLGIAGPLVCVPGLTGSLVCVLRLAGSLVCIIGVFTHESRLVMELSPRGWAYVPSVGRGITNYVTAPNPARSHSSSARVLLWALPSSSSALDPPARCRINSTMRSSRGGSFSAKAAASAFLWNTVVATKQPPFPQRGTSESAVLRALTPKYLKCRKFRAV